MDEMRTAINWFGEKQPQSGVGPPRYFGLYRAKVVDNDDSKSDDGKKLCRLKVRVFNLYSELKDSDLPWAWPCFMDGGGNDQGNVHIPEIGNTVWIQFEEGNPDRPVWVGTYYGSPGGEVETPKFVQGDDAEPASQDAEPLIDEPSSWKPEYPHNRGIRTPGGIVIEWDDTPSSRRIHLYHPSGSHYEFRENGDVVLHVKGNYHVVVDGDVEELYKQNHHQVVQQDQEQEILQNRTQVVVQDETLTTVGQQQVTVLQNRTTMVGMNDQKQVGMNNTEVTALVHSEQAGSAHVTKAPIITHTP